MIEQAESLYEVERDYINALLSATMRGDIEWVKQDNWHYALELEDDIKVVVGRDDDYQYKIDITEGSNHIETLASEILSNERQDLFTAARRQERGCNRLMMKTITALNGFKGKIMHKSQDQEMYFADRRGEMAKAAEDAALRNVLDWNQDGDILEANLSSGISARAIAHTSGYYTISLSDDRGYIGAFSDAGVRTLIRELQECAEVLAFLRGAE